jgi:hypothetical protein
MNRIFTFSPNRLVKQAGVFLPGRYGILFEGKYLTWQEAHAVNTEA